MNVLYIADYYSSGTGHPLDNFIEKLKKRKNHVELYTSNISLEKHMAFDTCTNIVKFRGVKIFNKTIYPALIWKLLWRDNPDIVHSHVIGFFSTFVSGYLKPIKKYPLVVTADFDIAEPTPSFFKKPYFFLYRKLSASFADIITTFTEKEKDILIERFGFDKEKIEVLPIGIDFERFSKERVDMRKRLGIKDKFVILNVSFLHPKKNLELALNALKSLDNVIFLHVGGIADEAYKNHLDALVKKFGLEDKVKFIGVVSNRDLAKYYKTADVFLQTGFRESYCIPILEAMACGLPVITPRAGVAHDVIKDFETGFLIEKESDIVWCVELLKSDKALRKKIGRNCECVAKSYDWGRIIDRLEQIYKNVLGRK